jgi:hypothetical protein
MQSRKKRTTAKAIDLGLINREGIMSDTGNTKKPGELTLSLLKIELEHMPGQTETFFKAFAEFLENQEDATGLRVDNLRLMAQTLRQSYATIDSALAQFDKFEKPEAGESDRED